MNMTCGWYLCVVCFCESRPRRDPFFRSFLRDTKPFSLDARRGSSTPLDARRGSSTIILCFRPAPDGHEEHGGGADLEPGRLLGVEAQDAGLARRLRDFEL